MVPHVEVIRPTNMLTAPRGEVKHGSRSGSLPQTNTNTTMSRKPDPLREQIKRLEALVKADRAKRRAAEKPLRAERRKLAEAVRCVKRTFTRATARRESMLSWPLGRLSERDAERVHGQHWRDACARIEQVTADLATAEAALAQFNNTHPDLR